MKKPKKTISIDSKFFFSMAIVSISFMLLLQAISAIFFIKDFMESETRDSLHQLDYISKQLNYYLISADNYSKTMIVDEDVQFYLEQLESSSDEKNETNRIAAQTKVRRITQSTPFIHSVTLYTSRGDFLMTTAVKPLLDDLNLSHSSYLLWSIRNKHPHLDIQDSLPVLSQIRPFYNVNTGALLGYIEISIPESVISEIYKENSTKIHHILMIDRAGRVTSTDGSHPLNQPYHAYQEVLNTPAGNCFYTESSIAFSTYFPELGWYIISETTLTAFMLPLISMFFVSLVITMACTGICIYVSRQISRSITSPINHLINHTKKIKEGNWVPIEEIQSDTEITTLFKSFNSMVNAQERLKNDLLESEKTKRKVSLELLQQQVNPHFLYNTLDNIYSLAELDEKQTLMDIVMNLSTFYRVGLSGGNLNITVKAELEIVESYLRIMQVRYFNKFNFTITCPKELYYFHCIKLLLQPIVENSIYYGIRDISYSGRVDILVKDTKSSILFVVQDNGTGFTQESYDQIWNADSPHFGIKSIHQRIQLYYGTKYGLTMENKPDGGCKTTIQIGKQEVIPYGTQSDHC